MINSINNNQNFEGLARLSQYGKKTITKQTTKNQDRIMKLMADDMATRGLLLESAPKEKNITFQRFIEMIMGKEIKFGPEQKFISNMQTVSQGTKGEINNYISYGTMAIDKPGSIHFSLDLQA